MSDVHLSLAAHSTYARILNVHGQLPELEHDGRGQFGAIDLGAVSPAIGIVQDKAEYKPMTKVHAHAHPACVLLCKRMHVHWMCVREVLACFRALE